MHVRVGWDAGGAARHEDLQHGHPGHELQHAQHAHEADRAQRVQLPGLHGEDEERDVDEGEGVHERVELVHALGEERPEALADLRGHGHGRI